jgi:UDPglucose 6-dehydrogenase
MLIIIKKTILIKKIIKKFGEDLKGKHFAFWGLSFKPETDDMREAPSLVMVDELTKRGATVCAYDPEAIHEAKKIIGEKITYSKDAYSALKNADALILLTEWREFRSPDWEKVRNELKSPILFDGRNIYESSQLRSNGFNYNGIGVK